MTKFFGFRCVLILLLAGPVLAAEPATVRLADQGKPTAAVIVSTRGLRKGRLLAAQSAGQMLVEHLARMSGAKLPLMDEDELKAATVKDGRLTVTDQAAGGASSFVLVGAGRLAGEMGVKADDIPPGGILIRTVGNVVVIAGSNDASDSFTTRHAAVEFLERLGCRYLWPGPSGKVIPKKETIEIEATDYRFAPPIRQRHIRCAEWNEGMSAASAIGLTKDQWQASRKQAAEGEGSPEDWLAWQRDGGDIGLRGGHAFGDAWQKWGKEHPDWFALQPDGTRDQSAAGSRCRLCVSNPGLIEAVAADVIERATKDPTLHSVSLCPNDGGYSSFCMCENCKKLDPPGGPKIKMAMFKKVGQAEREEIDYVSLTDRYVYFWNAVAERVVKVHPKLLMVVDAYSYYQEPPVKLKLHPNLVLRYVISSAEQWQGWRERAGSVFWRPNILINGGRDCLLNVYAPTLADSFHQLAAGGAMATDFDSILDHWAVHGLNYYVAARLSWDSSLKYDDMLRDYCRSGFGPAAGGVEEYFAKAAEATDRIGHPPAPGLDESRLAELRGLLAKAQKAVDEAGREGSGGKKLLQAEEAGAISERLAMLRTGLNFTELQWRISALAAKAAASSTGKGKAPADASAGLSSAERDQARQLMTLNFHVLRDLSAHQPLAINVASLLSQNGNYAQWRGLGWSELAAELLKSEHPSGKLSGKENSLAEMEKSLGLGQAGPESRPGR